MAPHVPTLLAASGVLRAAAMFLQIEVDGAETDSDRAVFNGMLRLVNDAWWIANEELRLAGADE